MKELYFSVVSDIAFKFLLRCDSCKLFQGWFPYSSLYAFLDAPMVNYHQIVLILLHYVLHQQILRQPNDYDVVVTDCIITQFALIKLTGVEICVIFHVVTHKIDLEGKEVCLNLIDIRVEKN